ncbi:hypothetical protein Cni_G25374 [Canna indica]|uniref:DUF4378 domain-containing protein n=1 Tax=Canna indica TaxID=4628 RepID=A0AAQ3KWX0_9LILI|nr:hypothetical protein Cni_G25374 [Canna indica]
MEAEWSGAERGFRIRRRRRRRRERAFSAGGGASWTSGYNYPKEQINNLDIDSDSILSNNFQKEENSDCQSAYDKISVKPTEKHMDQDISKEAEIRWSSSSIIAKLMGLDDQASVQVVHKQKKMMNGYFQETSVVGLKDKYQTREERSTWMGTAEHQRFKDVHEVRSVPKFEGYKKPINMALLGAKQYKLDVTKQYKTDVSFANPSFVDVKHFSRSESPRFSKESYNKLGDQDCCEQHYQNSFQEPNFSFRKYFHDLKLLVPSHLTSKITIFKSSKAAKIESGEVCPTSVPKIDRSMDLQNAVVSTSRKRNTGIVRHSPQQHSSSLIHNSEKLEYMGDGNPHIHHSHIVVLKPNVEKPHSKVRRILLRNPENGQSANRRLTGQTRFQEPHIGKKHWPKFSHRMEVFDHNTKGSRDTARWITEQLKESISSDEKFVEVSSMDESSCIIPGMNGLCNSEAFWRPSNHFNDQNNICDFSLSSSSEFDRELREITNQSKETGDYSKGSNTLAEMFDLSDLEAQNTALDSDIVDTISDENLTINSMRSSWGSPSSISSRESLEDGFFINLPKPMSLPASSVAYGSQSFSRVRQFGDEHFYTFNAPIRTTKRFNQIGKFSLISIKSGNQKLQSKKFGGETPEVNSKLPSIPNSVHVDKLLITKEAQIQLPMADEMTLENPKVSSPNMEEASVRTQADSKIPIPVGISVLKHPPGEDNSGYSEIITGNYAELYTNSLFSEPVDLCTKTSELLTSSNEDNGEDYQTLDLEEDFMDEEERDYTYLLDILIVSGVHSAQQDLLRNACYLPEYPVKPTLFERLEKKYGKLVAWSRSERKLMFDLTNMILAEVLAPCINMHPWVNTKMRIGPMWGSEGLLEKTWQMLEGRRMELHVGNSEDKVLDPKWLDLGNNINEIGMEIEWVLREELLAELVEEFMTG